MLSILEGYETDGLVIASFPSAIKFCFNSVSTTHLTQPRGS